MSELTPAWLLIAGGLLTIFAVDAAVRWWRANAWRRRRDDADEDDDLMC